MSLHSLTFTEQDFAGKGISPLPQYPALRSPQMQQKFDELVREVVAPRFNALLTLLAGDGGAASLGISLDALPAHNVADAIRYLLQREYTPQDLPEGGADGQLLVLENGSPVWKRPEASHIAVADEAGNFAAENMEAVLAELYALAAAAMPKAGGTFTGAAIDGSANAGEKLRSIAVKTAEAGQAGESVATGGLVLVRK
ncbi:MAG: hypothetical protein IJP01_01075 [Oscillospiraceae bacterium]|nr:hypothetical protein [Oscillospiraceae bacterium]